MASKIPNQFPFSFIFALNLLFPPIVLCWSTWQEAWKEPAYVDPKVPIDLVKFAKIIQYLNGRGWMLDNGGGMAISVQNFPIPLEIHLRNIGKEAVEKEVDPPRVNVFLVSPTAVQKEALNPADVYIFDRAMAEVHPRDYRSLNAPFPAPKEASKLNWSRNKFSVPSATLNLLRRANLEKVLDGRFSNKDFVATVHTHSMHANALTLHVKAGKTLKFANQEMLQGIEDRETGKYFDNNDTVEIPVLQSEMDEAGLLEPIMDALRANRKASAVIVHRHGLFVFGQNSWQNTKQMVECYEYLLQLEFQSRQLRAQMFMVEYLFANNHIKMRRAGNEAEVGTFEEYWDGLNESGHYTQIHPKRGQIGEMP